MRFPVENKYGTCRSYVAVFLNLAWMFHLCINPSEPLKSRPSSLSCAQIKLTDVQARLFRSDWGTMWTFRWTRFRPCFSVDLSLDFSSPNTHFMLLFLTIFPAKHMKRNLNWSRYRRWVCAVVRVHPHVRTPGVGAALLLTVATGQWRCVFKNCCRRLTGDLLDHELSV